MFNVPRIREPNGTGHWMEDATEKWTPHILELVPIWKQSDDTSSTTERIRHETTRRDDSRRVA